MEERTDDFYEEKLKPFLDFMNRHDYTSTIKVNEMNEFTTDNIEEYLELEKAHTDVYGMSFFAKNFGIRCSALSIGSKDGTQIKVTYTGNCEDLKV